MQHLQQQCDCGNGAHPLSQSWTEMNSDLWIHHSWTGKARLNWPVIQALVEVTEKRLIFVGRKCNVTVKVKKHPESKFKKQFTFPSHLLNSFICVFTTDFSFFIYLFIVHCQYDVCQNLCQIFWPNDCFRIHGSSFSVFLLKFRKIREMNLNSKVNLGQFFSAGVIVYFTPEI